MLYKILYFCDFDYYEKFEEQFIGATYIKSSTGPTPVEFSKIVERMEHKGEIACVETKDFPHEQRKYLPMRSADLAWLSARDVTHIDDTLNRLAQYQWIDLSSRSRRDVPWMTADDRKPLDYEAVFYRTPEFSCRSYDAEDPTHA